MVAGDKEKAGWRAHHAGWVYYLRNQPAEVLGCATRAAEHWKDSTPRQKAIVVQLQGIGHVLQKDYPAAIVAHRKVLKIDRAISPESDDVAIDLNSLAEAEHSNKDYDAAESDYREALHIAKKNNNQEHVAIYTGNLAGLALDREKWTEAESLARESLMLDEKIGHKELIASNSRRIAKALLKQNRAPEASPPALKEAEELARRAVGIFTRLRYKDLQEAQELLAEIEKVREESGD